MLFYPETDRVCSVYQMNILEIEYTGDSMPQGVVLCLVGKEGDENRSLRMHNLASLISLAKWAVAHKVSLCSLRGVIMYSQTLARARIRYNWADQQDGTHNKARTSARAEYQGTSRGVSVHS